MSCKIFSHDFIEMSVPDSDQIYIILSFRSLLFFTNMRQTLGFVNSCIYEVNHYLCTVHVMHEMIKAHTWNNYLKAFADNWLGSVSVNEIKSAAKDMLITRHYQISENITKFSQVLP